MSDEESGMRDNEKKGVVQKRAVLSRLRPRFPEGVVLATAKARTEKPG